MKVLAIVAAVILLSACSTTPYEQVYVSDHGDYYIAETEESNGYYVYTPVIMRYYGFDPWWYDRWFYSPYYSFYSRYHWPYHVARWYDPWYGGWHGYAAGYGGYHRGYGRHVAWVKRPTALPPTELLDEKGELPSPVNPIRANPGLEDSLERLYRDQEIMQRGRLAYRPSALEGPVNRSMMLKNPPAGYAKLTNKPIKIDSRKLKAVTPATWKQSRSVFESRSYPSRVSSSTSSVSSRPARASSARSSSAVRISRPRPDRYDRN